MPWERFELSKRLPSARFKLATFARSVHHGMDAEGIEPPTVRSESDCSVRLSYAPSLRRYRKRRESDSNRQAIAGHPLSKRAGSPRSRVTAHLSRTTRSAGAIQCVLDVDAMDGI